MKMADTVEGAGFWLPSEFFDDFLVDDKENSDENGGAESDSDFCFPTEFPYDVQTESRENLPKRWVLSTSPQSTLTHAGIWSSHGSPNGVTSPPASSFGLNDAVGDLIYRAAGQVAKLKLDGGDVPVPTKHKSLLGPPRSLEQFYSAEKTHKPSVLHNIYLQQLIVKQQKQQGCGMWYSEAQQMHEIRAGREMGTVQQNPTRIVGHVPRTVLLGGSGGGGGAAVKRKSAGTGVFLPRRYGNNNDCNASNSDSRKRPPGFSASFLPGGNVHALNKNLHSMNGFAQSQPHCQPKFNRGFIPDYDLLMARQNALLLQHRRSLLLEGSSPISRGGVYLPQEWTY